jgi:hypothetical protein
MPHSSYVGSHSFTGLFGSFSYEFQENLLGVWNNTSDFLQERNKRQILNTRCDNEVPGMPAYMSHRIASEQ